MINERVLIGYTIGVVFVTFLIAFLESNVLLMIKIIIHACFALIFSMWIPKGFGSRKK